MPFRCESLTCFRVPSSAESECSIVDALVEVLGPEQRMAVITLLSALQHPTNLLVDVPNDRAMHLSALSSLLKSFLSACQVSIAKRTSIIDRFVSMIDRLPHNGVEEVMRKMRPGTVIILDESDPNSGKDKKHEPVGLPTSVSAGSDVVSELSNDLRSRESALEDGKGLLDLPTSNTAGSGLPVVSDLNHPFSGPTTADGAVVKKNQCAPFVTDSVSCSTTNESVGALYSVASITPTVTVAEPSGATTASVVTVSTTNAIALTTAPVLVLPTTAAVALTTAPVLALPTNAAVAPTTTAAPVGKFSCWNICCLE